MREQLPLGYGVLRLTGEMAIIDGKHTMIVATTDDVERDITTLVAMAGLDVQHRCSGCDTLLDAFGRDNSRRWSCPSCNLSDAIVAMPDQRVRS